MTVFAPVLGLIWKSLEDYGLNPHEIFLEAGIDPAMRSDITARVDERQADDLIWLARQRSNDDGFAFHIAQNMMPSFLGALGLAWLTSASLRKAIERFQRYGRMVRDGLVVEVVEEADQLLVRFLRGDYTYRDPVLREAHQIADFVQLCRLICGANFCPTRIGFVHEEPAKTSEYFRFFKCDLGFGEKVTSVVIPASVADEPLLGFNPQLVQNLDHMIVDYLARLDRDDIVNRTRGEILKGLPDGTVNLESVAESLNMSTRTLIRKLSDEGESFKNLLAATRKELGERYVMDKNLSLTEISFLLGFSETSSFSRAYKNWTGMSPRAHRASL